MTVPNINKHFVIDKLKYVSSYDKNNTYFTVYFLKLFIVRIIYEAKRRTIVL